MDRKEALKQQILALTREYYQEVHAEKSDFRPGESFVNYGGRYFDEKEMVNLVDSSLDFWLPLRALRAPGRLGVARGALALRPPQAGRGEGSGPGRCRGSRRASSGVRQGGLGVFR